MGMQLTKPFLLPFLNISVMMTFFHFLGTLSGLRTTLNSSWIFLGSIPPLLLSILLQSNLLLSLCYSLFGICLSTALGNIAGYFLCLRFCGALHCDLIKRAIEIFTSLKICSLLVVKCFDNWCIQQ